MKVKDLKIFLIIGALALLTSSCFLFQPSHERCPAYGLDQDDNEQIDLKLIEDQEEKI